MKNSFLNRLNSFSETISPTRFFCITAAVFGLLFVLITPPFEAPDEPVHFFRAYQVSTLNLSVDKVGSVYGGILPASLQETVAKTWDGPNVRFHPNVKYPLVFTKQAFSIKNSSEKKVYDFSTTAPYSPVSYVPQALGIGVARLLSGPPILMMYAGRLFNLVAWIALFYMAISLIPRKKWAIVFIGLIPMGLFQAASLSADVMAVGLLAVLLAAILRFMDSKKLLSRKQLGLLLAALILLALSKQIMFIFVPLVLLLPNKLLSAKRQTAIWIKAGLMILPVLIFGLWMLHINSIPLSTSVEPINPNAQLKFIILHPYSFINVFWNTFFYSWGDGITKSFIGNFGWVDTPLSDLIVTLGYISMFIVLVANPANYRIWLSKNQKLLISLLIAVYILAASAALYVYFTPVGFKIVNGIVGRYFLPVAILLVPLAYSSWLKITRRAYIRFAVLSPLLLLAASTITIFVRYYVNNV